MLVTIRLSPCTGSLSVELLVVKHGYSGDHYLEQAPDRSQKGNVAIALQGGAIKLVASRDHVLALKELELCL